MVPGGAARGDQAPGRVGTVVRTPALLTGFTCARRAGASRLLSCFVPVQTPSTSWVRIQGLRKKKVHLLLVWHSGLGDHSHQVYASVRGSPPAGGEWPHSRPSRRALRDTVGGRVRQPPSPVAMATAGKPASRPPAAGPPGVQLGGRTWGMTTDPLGVSGGPKQLGPPFLLVWCLGWSLAAWVHLHLLISISCSLQETFLKV